MHRIQHLFVLVRAGDRHNLGMHAGDILRVRTKTAGHDDLAVFLQSLTNRLKTFGLGAIKKPTGVHNHRIGTGIVGRNAIAFGAQPGQDAFAIDQSFGAAERDHANSRLAIAARVTKLRTWRKVGADIGRILNHAGV